MIIIMQLFDVEALMSDCNCLLRHTSEIVSAYIKSNKVPQEEVGKIIEDVYRLLKRINDSSDVGINAIPAVSIESSVSDDFLICLEDGKKLKMLKRHLKSVYNMSVEEYRRKWGLPPNYPSVAKNYAFKRSFLAKKIGLGQRDPQAKVTLRVVGS